MDGDDWLEQRNRKPNPKIVDDLLARSLKATSEEVNEFEDGPSFGRAVIFVAVLILFATIAAYLY